MYLPHNWVTVNHTSVHYWKLCSMHCLSRGSLSNLFQFKAPMSTLHRKVKVMHADVSNVLTDYRILDRNWLSIPAKAPYYVHFILCDAAKSAWCLITSGLMQKQPSSDSTWQKCSAFQWAYSCALRGKWPVQHQWWSSLIGLADFCTQQSSILGNRQSDDHCPVLHSLGQSSKFKEVIIWMDWWWSFYNSPLLHLSNFSFMLNSAHISQLPAILTELPIIHSP